MNTKKKYVLGFIILIVGFLIYISFGTDSNKKAVIGAMLPLSGPSASLGERVKNGMDVWLSQHKDANIEVVYEDDMGDTKGAFLALQKLISVNNTNIIVGTVKSDPLLGIASTTEAKKIILFSPTAGADAISDAGDYIFRNIERAEAHGKRATAYFLENKAPDIAVFTANASNAKSYSTNFIREFEKAGGKIASNVSYEPNQTDFRTDIAKIVKNSGVYIGVGVARDSGILVRQLRNQGFKGPIIMSVAGDAPEFFAAAGEVGEGTLVTGSFIDTQTEQGKTFMRDYFTQTGSHSDGFAANGYDALTILHDSIEKCKGTNTDCVRDRLYETQNFIGVSGTYGFNEKGDVEKPVLLKVAKNGIFETISK